MWMFLKLQLDMGWRIRVKSKFTSEFNSLSDWIGKCCGIYLLFDSKIDILVVLNFRFKKRDSI